MIHLRLVQALLLLGACLFASPPLFAQCPSFRSYPYEARLHLGVLPTFLKDHVDTEMIPLALEVRYRPSPRYSVGLLAGQSIARARQYHHSGSSRVVRNRFRVVALRGAAHTLAFDRLEFYGGMLLAYSFNQVDYLTPFTPKLPNGDLFATPKVRNGFFFSAFLGAQLRIHSRLHCFGEIGYGLSLLTAGTALRF